MTKPLSKMSRRELTDVCIKGQQRSVDLAAHAEKLNSKLADINNSLYGQNLHIAGWHLNGDTEPMDTWFEYGDWEPEPCGCTSLARLIAENVEAALGHVEGLMAAGARPGDAIAETRRRVQESAE